MAMLCSLIVRGGSGLRLNDILPVKLLGGLGLDDMSGWTRRVLTIGFLTRSSCRISQYSSSFIIVIYLILCFRYDASPEEEAIMWTGFYVFLYYE